MIMLKYTTNTNLIFKCPWMMYLLIKIHDLSFKGRKECMARCTVDGKEGDGVGWRGKKMIKLN